MWRHDGISDYGHSNFLGISIQCQLNAPRTPTFPAFSSQPASQHTRHQSPSNHQLPSNHFPAAPAIGSSLPTCNLSAAARDCHGYNARANPHQQYEYTATRCHSDDSVLTFDAPRNSVPFSDSKYGFSLGTPSPVLLNSIDSIHSDIPGFSAPCSSLNDSGYGSPHCRERMNNNAAFDQSKPLQREFSPPVFRSPYSQCSPVARMRVDESCSLQQPTVTSSGLGVAPVTPDEDMKLAMREKDVMQRLFSLRAADVDGIHDVEKYFQSQTSIIDVERHHVLSQMTYDNGPVDTIQKYYNRKLQSLLECIEEKLTTLENARSKGGKNTRAGRNSRLLPKRAIKVMEAWYKDNLGNPYLSREASLTMAAECSISVDQIRKWFANKRYRSINGQLKARDSVEGQNETRSIDGSREHPK